MTVRRVPPRPRPWFAALAWLLVAAASFGGAPAPAVAAPPYTLEERAAAIASPALVYVEMVFTGYVRDKKTTTALRTRPVTVTRRCSGFVVNPNGYVVTNGACLQPGEEVLREGALNSLGWSLIDEERLDRAGLDGFVDENRDRTLYTGRDPAEAPEARLFGQLIVATANLTTGPAVPGEIVERLEADQGNVALVKLERSNLPVVELNTSRDLQQGQDLVSIGFDGTDSGSGGAIYTPRWKSVTLAGLGTRGLVPVYRVNGEVGSTSRGGMLIDTSGRVVGMIDSDQARSDRENRAAIRSATIAELLNNTGVANRLGETDRRYRSGLDAYFAGRYSSAISAFDTVADESPHNQVAREYRQKARDRREIEGEAAEGPPVWLAGGLGAVGGAVVAGLVAAAVVGRRRSARRRQAAGLAPYPYAPVSADPISGIPISGMPMSGAPMLGYRQGWPAPPPALPAQPQAPLDEHGLPAYPGGAHHFPESAQPPATGDEEPNRGGA